MSNNFFLKHNIPWLGLEIIRVRRRWWRRWRACFSFPLIYDGVIILACSQVPLSRGQPVSALPALI